MTTNHYKHTIWTNHAKDMLKQRRLSQADVYQTFQYPQSSQKKPDGSWQFTKKFGSQTVSVIAKPTDGHDWLIISCWINPPHPGTPDYYKKLRYRQYLRSTPLKKLLMHFQKTFFHQDF